MSKILLILFIVLFVPSVMAVDNTFFSSPTCINPSYDTGTNDIFMITENHATLSNSTSSGVDSVGFFTPKNIRVYNGVNITCSISDRVNTGTTTGRQRVWGTSGDGSFWYTDIASDNYASGFFNPLYDLISLVPTVLVDTFSGQNSNYARPMAQDSHGNIYTNGSSGSIRKYYKDLLYSGNGFYVPQAGRDYDSDGLITGVYILDIQIDSNDNLHVLIGTERTTNGVVAGSVTSLSKTTIDSNGNFIWANRTLDTDNTAGAAGIRYTGFYHGGLILDNTNPIYNFTYGYTKTDVAFTPREGFNYIYHLGNDSGTVTRTDIAGGDITSVSYLDDLGYYNYQIFASFPANKLVRSYVTTFQGSIPTSGVTTGTPDLTYSTSSISSQQATYANNSNVLLDINVVVGPLSLVDDLYFSPSTNYRWKMELNDPSGILIAQHFSEPCVSYSSVLLTVSCSMNETLSITPPINNWTAGTYTAYLKEYNINTYALATLDSTTFEVLNQSANTTGITVNIPIASGTGFSALSTIDSWTAMFGLGVNPISKFMFSMMWIVFFMTVGAILLKGMSGGVIFGLFPYSFFIFIEYLPSWTVIVLGIVLAIKLNIFR